jgi:hypothetical protein
MTKALVTIEVDVDTYGFPVQTGLGESSNPEHPPQRRIAEAKRDHIWNFVYDLLKNKPQFIQVVKVSLTKEAN